MARETTAQDDPGARRSHKLTPAELAAANREKGTTFGLSARARAIEERLGME